ncbi:unnamed protein product [Sphagnum jensenii]|uniref:Uncharacterized protein n=1 Tax=Sphagnum jensenii TaxID=128206 RepID=A0ABP1A8C3_9BRYO
MGVRSAKKCRNKAARVAAVVLRSSIEDAYLLLGRRWESVTWSGFACAREHEIVFDPFSSSLSAFTVPDLSQVISFVKVFPKVCHGWTSHYDKKNPEVVAHANKAHNNTPDWYAK